MDEQEYHAWLEAGPQMVVAGGHQPVKQIEAQHPEKTVAGYVVA